MCNNENFSPRTGTENRTEATTDNLDVETLSDSFDIEPDDGKYV